jgi:hypothetical protein
MDGYDAAPEIGSITTTPPCANPMRPAWTAAVQIDESSE